MIYHLENVISKKDKLPLFLQIFSINYMQEPVSRPTGFPLHQFFYCVKGQGEALIDSYYYALNEGQFLYIDKSSPHFYRARTPDWTVHSVCLDFPENGNFLPILGIGHHGIYNCSDPELFSRYVKSIHQASKSTLKGKSLMLTQIGYDFLLDLSRVSTFTGPSDKLVGNSKIRNIVNYLSQHYMDYITLDELASQISISKEYMCKLFKKEMGQTIIQYLTRYRIAQSRVLLCTYPEKRVHEIAKMCGFDSAGYFITVFQREVHMTPEQFRNIN